MASNNEPVKISDAASNVPANLWIRTSELVAKYKPVDLSEGFSDSSEVVKDRLKAHLIATQHPDASYKNNQYTRAKGNPELVTELADMYSGIMGRKIDPMDEILVTVGAEESLYCIIKASVNPGDEVIVIDPSYDSFAAMVAACGGKPRYVPMTMRPGGVTANDFILDEDELTQAFNEKTKAIVINTPNNPTGKVFSKKEIMVIGELCKKYNCLYISDEVYEWYQYGSGACRVASLPGMWERTVTIGSAGKTFNVTGWKIGWSIGPKYLISAAFQIHCGTVFAVATPLQMALAHFFREEKALIGTKDSYWYWLVETLKQKRNKLYNILSKAGFQPIMPDGGYFMVADTSNLGIDPSGVTDSVDLGQQMSDWMIIKKGIATIPLSLFCSDDNKSKFGNYLRFCFIKTEETLNSTEEKLKDSKL